MKRSLLALALVGAFAAAAQAANPVVVMKTSKGDIKIELFEDKAPITVKNFLKYVEDKHYDGTIFHRVIPTFMIQGGGYEKGLGAATSREDVDRKEKKTRESIKNESTNGLANQRGTLAMARRPQPDSATAQFFINVKDNDFLDRKNAGDGVGYAVFGKVIEGMDVVDKIKEVKTKTLFPGFRDVPAEEVVIESVRRADK
jgi:cyclophilin family peptidyl-prolyl cis-trans isomerase